MLLLCLSAPIILVCFWYIQSTIEMFCKNLIRDYHRAHRLRTLKPILTHQNKSVRSPKLLRRPQSMEPHFGPQSPLNILNVICGLKLAGSTDTSGLGHSSTRQLVLVCPWCNKTLYSPLQQVLNTPYGCA